MLHTCILCNVFHDYGINDFDVKTEYYRLEYFIYNLYKINIIQPTITNMTQDFVLTYQIPMCNYNNIPFLF